MENEKIKITCPNCKKQIYLTFNTKECPKCGFKYDDEAVKNIFYKLESERANSKLIQIGKKMEKSGAQMEKAGDAMNSLGNSMMGCGCLLVVLFIIVLLIL